MRATLLLLAALTTPATAQWQLLDAHTTADLRGIDNVGHGIVWASGTNGTVLRSEDNGTTWQTCPIPPDAEKLDFRGIQAFDNKTAIVMSSGKGDLSRLYKTTDGCQTWTLVFTNPDIDGFFDALAATPEEGFVIGDPVANHFVIFLSSQSELKEWTPWGKQSCYTCAVFDHQPFKAETLFAASNSVLEGSPRSNIEFVTGGPDTSLFHGTVWLSKGVEGYPATASWTSSMPLAKGPTAGAFSFAHKSDLRDLRHFSYAVVGGDYKKPDSSMGTAAYSKDGGVHWKAATTPPHGYRSAVAYDAPTKTWITVGPNGTDISTDDGRNWRALKPSTTDAPDADKNWNALSLPFVVGPKGRIGILNPTALKPNP